MSHLALDLFSRFFFRTPTAPTSAAVQKIFIKPSLKETIHIPSIIKPVMIEETSLKETVHVSTTIEPAIVEEIQSVGKTLSVLDKFHQIVSIEDFSFVPESFSEGIQPIYVPKEIQCIPISKILNIPIPLKNYFNNILSVGYILSINIFSFLSSIITTNIHSINNYYLTIVRKILKSG